jgi:hypothetical protein
MCGENTHPLVASGPRVTGDAPPQARLSVIRMWASTGPRVVHVAT